MPEEKEREFLKHKSWSDFRALIPVIILMCAAVFYFYLAAMTPIELGSATGEIIGFRVHSGFAPWYTAIVRIDNVTSVPANREFENPAEAFLGICEIEEFKYFKCNIGSRVTVLYRMTRLVPEYWIISELLG